MRISPVVQSLTEPLLSPLVSTITGVIGGGFNPRSFFNDGSIGVLYDNNDLTSFYLDAAGTTPATVNGLVGLQLDKSQGLVLGAEIIPQPLDLSAGDWATQGALSAVTANSFTNASGAGAGRSRNITTGKWYRFTATFTKSDAVTLFGVYDSSPATPLQTSTAASGTFTGTYLATGPVYLRLAGNASVTITSFSLKELPGNHRYQTTATSRPTLRGTPIGGNLVTNGDFSNGTTGWSAGNLSSIAVASGKAQVTQGASNFGDIRQNITTSTGGVYLLRGKIASLNGATIRLVAQNSTTLAVLAQSQAVTSSSEVSVEFYFTATSDTTRIAIRFDASGASGDVLTADDIDIRDVSAGSVTAPYGLQYEVDDFLQTASVNFSATDKMFVCAGVRKFVDVNNSVAAELGTAAGGQVAGRFSLFAPRFANSFGFQSTGDGVGVGDAYSSDSPPLVTAVVSGIGDISGDSAIVRVNGTQKSSSATNQGTGNYGNYPLYFGRRGGTSLPFNGIDFGFVIVGKTLTAAQIASTERWMAQRTGVSI